MHPDIIKFWDKISKVCVCPDKLEISETLFRLYWFVYYYEATKYKYEYVACKSSDKETITYYFRGASYDETEMLQIIKLKAFL